MTGAINTNSGTPHHTEVMLVQKQQQVDDQSAVIERQREMLQEALAFVNQIQGSRSPLSRRIRKLLRETAR